PHPYPASHSRCSPPTSSDAVFSSSYGALRALHSFPTRRSSDLVRASRPARSETRWLAHFVAPLVALAAAGCIPGPWDYKPAAARDRKSTRLNSSHVKISYAVFCLKKKNQQQRYPMQLIRHSIIA